MMNEAVVGKLNTHPDWGVSKHIASGYIRLYGENDVELSKRRFTSKYNREIILTHWQKMFGKTLNGKYYTIEPDYEEY